MFGKMNETGENSFAFLLFEKNIVNLAVKLKGIGLIYEKCFLE